MLNKNAAHTERLRSPFRNRWWREERWEGDGRPHRQASHDRDPSASKQKREGGSRGLLSRRGAGAQVRPKPERPEPSKACKLHWRKSALSMLRVLTSFFTGPPMFRVLVQALKTVCVSQPRPFWLQPSQASSPNTQRSQSQDPLSVQPSLSKAQGQPRTSLGSAYWEHCSRSPPPTPVGPSTLPPPNHIHPESSFPALGGQTFNWHI